MKQVAADGYTNVEIDSICEVLQKKYTNVKERYPTIAPVACLGPSGVGKSSTINSILHQVSVAYESDSSSRGTNLVHEFAAPTLDQTSMFKVVAPYLRPDQIAIVVQRHVTAILTYLGADEGITDDSEIDDLERKYNTAIDFFHLLLCGHKEFLTRFLVIEYFKLNIQTDLEDTIEDLTELIEEFKATRNLVDETEHFTAENDKELGNVFREISRVAHSSTGKPHPWPILTKIEVCHENDLLNAGLLIGDTPGIDDINQASTESIPHLMSKVSCPRSYI